MTIYCSRGGKRIEYKSISQTRFLFITTYSIRSPELLRHGTSHVKNECQRQTAKHYTNCNVVSLKIVFLISYPESLQFVSAQFVSAYSHHTKPILLIIHRNLGHFYLTVIQTQIRLF